MLVNTDKSRINSVYVRAEKLGFSKMVAKNLLNEIANFKNVESFMYWKSNLKDELKYIVERIGANNYRKLRDML